jgi:hypothetical protein
MGLLIRVDGSIAGTVGAGMEARSKFRGDRSAPSRRRKIHRDISPLSLVYDEHGMALSLREKGSDDGGYGFIRG